MKTARFTKSLQRGFTLIELIVVVAILGVLSVVLVTTIDPLDKINAANDSGVISTIGQLGKANDAFAANNSNLYVSANTFAASVTALNTSGEVKYSAVTAPANYTYSYLAPTNCSTTPSLCTSYVYYVNLRSKRYTSGNTGTNLSYYVYANGKGCTLTNQSAAPSASTYNCP